MSTVVVHSNRIAAHRPPRSSIALVVPWLFSIGLVVSTLQPGWPGMCALAFLLLGWLKWSTWRRLPARLRRERRRACAYFLAWPGLDADRFCDANRAAARPAPQDWFAPLAKTAFGALLIWGVAPRLAIERPWLASVVGFVGLVASLHFGTFHLLALAWRCAGVDAEPLMDRPFAATSLAEFWGRRWNRAYRRVSFEMVFRPLTARLGSASALLTAFLVSGLVHDLVISIPARGGYSGPTAYFMLQALGLRLERTRPVRSVLTSHPAAGWCFTAAVTIAPLGLLFHEPFLTRVIAPFLTAIGASCGAG